jgi:AcrR family transcriptional regulator
MEDRTSAPAPAPAGRPRNPGVDPRVRDATLALLAERGYTGLRIDDVARASGVAKSTIYRRWPSLALLVLETVESALGPREVPLTGDVEADLATLVTVVHDSLTTNPVGWTLPGIGIDLMRQPELAAQYRRRFIDPLRDLAITLLRRGAAEGRFNPEIDPETLVDAVAGTILYRRVVGAPAPDLSAVLALALAALRP